MSLREYQYQLISIIKCCWAVRCSEGGRRTEWRCLYLAGRERGHRSVDTLDTGRYRQQTCDNGRRGGEREGTTGTRVHTAYTIKQFFKQSLFIIYTLLWKIFANHLLWCLDILWGWRISFGSESCNWLELINKIVRTRRVFRVLLCHAWT